MKHAAGHLRSIPRILRYAVLTALAACASQSRAVDSKGSDRLHERITVVDVAPDGSARVEFEYSQRRFRIDPARSPDAKGMIAFAQAARAAGRPVHAIVAPTGERTKGDDGPPFVLIHLADTPD